MYRLSKCFDQPPEEAGFFKLPLSIRNKIYTYIIQAEKKPTLESFPLTFACRQIQDEFASTFGYLVNVRFRCCLGRTLHDRETTKFYPLNYHDATNVSAIELNPQKVTNLKTCIVRCTIEELSDWERRSETGVQCFKDCIRILVRTFTDCQYMRDIKISFNHFVLSDKKGLLEADETWDRLKDLAQIPGIKGIKFVTPGLGEDFIWMREKSGKKGRGREEWVRIVEEKVYSSTPCGAKIPKGYGLRRGCT